MPAPSDAADRVRRFNRFYTRRLGLLDARHLRSPFSLAEARVLYELAHRVRPTAGEIAGALGMDAGYLSRLLRGFRRRGLVSARIAGADRRVRRLALTPRGRRAFVQLDARATAEVSSLLGSLPATDEGRLLDSLEAVQTLLADRDAAADAATVALRPPLPGDLGWVVQRHGELYHAEYGWNLDFERLVARIVGEFAAADPGPTQRCWIATLGGRRAGCVFLVPASSATAKLRLLLVEPWARGHGIGARLVEECVAAARTAGCRILTLWTNDVLVAARRLYERAGFRLVASERHSSFGKPLLGQTWELTLQRDQPSR